MQNEILELWKCFVTEFERFAVHIPLRHTLFLLIPSRHLCYIYYWSISLPLHVTSYVHREKVNPGKTCYQLYLGATEVWSAMKVNMLFCIFCPQKSYTVHILKEGKNSLAHTVLGHRNMVTGCLPQYLLLVYNSSLKTETQTQVFNYRRVHPNLTLTQHKLCRMLNPTSLARSLSDRQPWLLALHSLEPAKQERITPRTGSRSPGRTLLCRAIKRGPETICVNSLNHKPQLALPLKHLRAAPCKAGARYFGIQIAAFGGPPMPFGLFPFLIADLQTLSLGSSRNWGTFASRFGTLPFHCHPVLLTQAAAHPPLLDWLIPRVG